MEDNERISDKSFPDFSKRYQKIKLKDTKERNLLLFNVGLSTWNVF